MRMHDPEPDYAAFAAELDDIAALAADAGDGSTAARLHKRARKLRWAGATPPGEDEEERDPRWLS